MTMISYAQNGEDVVLDRVFPADHIGFYVDVGASDPTVDSVTKHFYDRGWHGVNVEPAEGALRALREARPRDINLGIGLAASPGEQVFYELPVQMTGCSTFSGKLAEEYRAGGWQLSSRTVQVITLAQLCEEHAAGETIDFLKIDVEGGEADVLAGGDFEQVRPRVVVVEATVPGSRTPAHQAWEPELLQARYSFVLFDGLNRFYVRQEEAALGGLLASPANVLDDYVSHRCDQWRRRAEAGEAQAARVPPLVTALEQTRGQLASSQAALRDARAELGAARAALTDALR